MSDVKMKEIAGKSLKEIHGMMTAAGSFTALCDSERDAEEMAKRITRLVFDGRVPVAWKLDQKKQRATFLLK